EEDLARLMERLFATARDHLRERIRVEIAKIAGDGSSPSAPHMSTARDLPMLRASLSGERTPSASARPNGWSGGLGRPAWLVGLTVAGVLTTAMAWIAVHDRPREIQATPVPNDGPSIKPVHLHVETDPPGAFIEWKGARFGPTPTEITLDPG